MWKGVRAIACNNISILVLDRNFCVSMCTVGIQNKHLFHHSDKTIWKHVMYLRIDTCKRNQETNVITHTVFWVISLYVKCLCEAGFIMFSKAYDDVKFISVESGWCYNHFIISFENKPFICDSEYIITWITVYLWLKYWMAETLTYIKYHISHGLCVFISMFITLFWTSWYGMLVFYRYSKCFWRNTLWYFSSKFPTTLY